MPPMVPIELLSELLMFFSLKEEQSAICPTTFSNTTIGRYVDVQLVVVNFIMAFIAKGDEIPRFVRALFTPENDVVNRKIIP